MDLDGTYIQGEGKSINCLQNVTIQGIVQLKLFPIKFILRVRGLHACIEDGGQFFVPPLRISQQLLNLAFEK